MEGDTVPTRRYCENNGYPLHSLRRIAENLGTGARNLRTRCGDCCRIWRAGIRDRLRAANVPQDAIWWRVRAVGFALGGGGAARGGNRNRPSPAQGLFDVQVADVGRC